MPLYTTPPDNDDIHRMAEEALAALPAVLASRVRGLSIMVEDLADDATLEDLGIETPWELTGLYRGIPVTERSVSDPVALPDMVFLYREAILMEWIETGEDLGLLVSSVLVHEIAHHLGFSEADIERIEADGRP